MTYLARTCAAPADFAAYATRALIADESFRHGFAEILSRYRDRAKYHTVTDDACQFASWKRFWSSQRLACQAFLADRCAAAAIARRRRPVPSLFRLCVSRLSTADRTAAKEYGLQ